MRLILAILLPVLARAQAPVHPCAGSDCHWGADADGNASFWAAKAADGRFEAGYESLLAAQRHYNAWAAGNERGDRYRGVDWTDKARGGWKGDRIEAPRRIAEDGRLSPETLMLGVYENGAELLRLSSEWQTDCRRNEHDEKAPECGAIDQASAPPPHDAVMKERAEILRKGIAASRLYERKVDDLDPYASTTGTRSGSVSRYDFKRLPKGALGELEEISKNIEVAVKQARKLERKFRAHRDPYE